MSTSSGCYLLYEDPYRNRSASVVLLQKNDFDTAAEENLNNIPSLKFQYLGTAEGFMYMFPAVKTRECGTLDPRSRFKETW